LAQPGSTVEPATDNNAAVSSKPDPSYVKTRLGEGLTFESYTSSGIVEVPEMVVPAHVLILRTGSPSVIEWRSDGLERRAELAPGTISLIPAGFRHAARVFRPLPGEASILQMVPRFFDRGVGEISKGAKLELIEHRDLNDPQIIRLVKSIQADIASGLLGGSLFSESVAIALSVHIASHYSAEKPLLESYRGGLSRSNLNRVREYIDAHMGNRLELGELASVAGLNLFHFARAFRQSTGQPPHQYVVRQRIERAKQILRDPLSTVLEASARTGFVDQSHFSKVFRRIVGVSPSEFRAGVNDGVKSHSMRPSLPRQSGEGSSTDRGRQSARQCVPILREGQRTSLTGHYATRATQRNRVPDTGRGLRTYTYTPF
jgi:AraC family transcriptional regulator